MKSKKSCEFTAPSALMSALGAEVKKAVRKSKKSWEVTMPSALKSARQGRPMLARKASCSPWAFAGDGWKPPGPIGNPGRSSVDAVLEPADVPYLYFVAADDRSHYFSTTLEEHNRAVARYRQYRRLRATSPLAPADGRML